jgi:polar amino acid transport system substrate-binding protein
MFLGIRPVLAAVLLVLASLQPGLGQSQEKADSPFIPSFWDPKKRLERPSTASIRAIRFITDDDYPPFNFAGPDGQLSGFNVELARLICEELQIACTIQARRWDTLIDSLVRQRNGDAIIASLAISPANLAQMDFTRAYYRTPARFLVRKESRILDVSAETLSGKTIAVVERSAHAAFLADLFPEAKALPVVELAEARKALIEGTADAVFADGIVLALWLNGTDSKDCCRFLGGPYLESRYFGEGVGIAVRKDADGAILRQALDYALARIARDGRYSALYLKYFPVGFF